MVRYGALNCGGAKAVWHEGGARAIPLPSPPFFGLLTSARLTDSNAAATPVFVRTRFATEFIAAFDRPIWAKITFYVEFSSITGPASVTRSDGSLLKRLQVEQ